jgi:WD40 repeat protein
VSRIFLSHSSADNASAQALASWLEANGWTDYFLDIDPEQGLAPGERWQEALRRAADRCEAVVFLISPAWRDSRWCLAEFILAKQLNKKIFGVVIEPVVLDQLREMTAEWQLCDLVSGDDRREVVATSMRDGVAGTISFSQSGLSRLKLGLQKAGLDPATFSWPPPHDPQRPPYRGLKPLDVDDAAIFFGRETAITRGLDALRGMRERGVEGLFLILGASGAGKSSFLRAGLWPRLNRNDREFLPLPIVRPQGAVMTGPTGLVASLESAFRVRKVRRTRADVRARIRSADGLISVLDELCGVAAALDAHDRPVIVLPIDQAEELFGEGQEENDALLDLLGDVVAMSTEASTHQPRVLAVAAIRSDAYHRMQSHPRLAHVAQVPFNLGPILPANFKDVITGPAARATAAGQSIRIEPALVDKLLADADGADALPLLAFTLERLFVDYGGEGVLSAAGYDALGGIRGSIDAAIEAAFTDPGAAPVVPTDRVERERLLRRAFVPWLARVDPTTDARQRRTAAWDDIPVESRAVIERLVDARLLIRDRQVLDDASASVTTVEVSHEALLRQWSALTGWLDEDAESLKVVEAAGRAAVEWLRNERNAAWLVHSDERLQRAEALLMRADFAELMRGATADYLVACRASMEAARADREAQLARITAEQRLTALAQRRARRLLVAGALILIAFAGWTFVQNRNLGRARAQALTVASKEALAGKVYDRALRLAVLALEELTFGSVPEAEAQLARAATASPYLFQLTLRGEITAGVSADGRRMFGFSEYGGIAVADTIERTSFVLPRSGRVTGASFNGDGTLIVVSSDDQSARVYDTRNGQEIARFAHDAPLVTAEFSPDGQLLVTVSGRTARVWRVRPPQEVAKLEEDGKRDHDGDLLSAAFVAGGERVATLSVDGVLRIFDAQDGRLLASLKHGSEDDVVVGALSDDRERMATISGPVARVFDLRRGTEIARVTHADEVTAVAFSPDGAHIATGSNDQTARVTDVTTNREVKRFKRKGEVYFVGFNAAGDHLLTGADTVSAWDFNDKEIARFVKDEAELVASPDRRYLFSAGPEDIVHDVDAAVSVAQVSHEGLVSAAFSRDGLRLASWGSDGTVRLWDVTAREIALARHDAVVMEAATSSDGVHFAVMDVDGSLVIGELASGRDLRRIDRTGVLAMAFSPDGKWLASAHRGGRVRLFEVESDKEISSAFLSADPHSVVFSRDGSQLYVTTNDGVIHVSDTRTGNMIARASSPCRLSKTVISAHRRQALSICESYAQVVDIARDKPLGRVQHSATVRSIAFLSDGARVLTASDDRTARISDAVTGNEICRIDHKDKIPLAFTAPNDAYVVTASEDQTVRISDPTTCAERARIATSMGRSVYATFSQDGRRLALSNGYSDVRIYDTRNWTEIDKLGSGPVTSLAFSPDGTRLVVGSSIYRLRGVWNTTWLTMPRWPLLETTCTSKLLGLRTLSVQDVAAVPLLEGRQGEDVCASGSWLNHLLRRAAR